MKIKHLTAAVALAGIFAAAYSVPASAEAASAETTVSEVTVVSGDTLSGIAMAHGTTYVRLYDANQQIEHPDVIDVGQAVRIPAADEQLTSRSLPSAAVVAQPVATAVPTAKRSAVAHQAAATSVSGDVWDRLARCEAGGNWAINTGNGFYGGLQFTMSSWQSVGGSGYPHQASKSEQIAMGERLLAKQGWNAWPACSAMLGLRQTQ